MIMERTLLIQVLMTVVYGLLIDNTGVAALRREARVAVYHGYTDKDITRVLLGKEER